MADPMNKRLLWVIAALAAAILACTREAPTAAPWNPSDQGLINTPCPQGVSVTGACSMTPTPTVAWYDKPTHLPDEPVSSPTPDAPRIVPTLRLEPDRYVIQSGDTLAIIAQRYNVNWEVIAGANQLTDPNSVSIGQELIIPAPTPSGKAPGFKIIPDSELVYGPNSILFDIDAFIKENAGYLSSYTEKVDGEELSATEIIEKVSFEYSVNPRILLTVLEYISGWVTKPNTDSFYEKYPLGYIDDRYEGLYRQLSYGANQLNRGFYLLQVNGVGAWLLADGSRMPLDGTINPGTAGVQNLMATLLPLAEWEVAVSETGVYATYQKLFGYPFDFAIEPLAPANLQQPVMVLPFQPEKTWSFTGGPHAGWGDGSAWAALDFAPPGEPRGCVESADWVTAVADGLVVYSQNGLVIEDLDGDGQVQTGWSVLYLHIESKDRVKAGVVLHTNDPIGHPSCEGGISDGTHLHLARRYNGMWIAADGTIPFNLDGYISSGKGIEYDGYLTRSGEKIEAFNGVHEINQIKR